MRSCLTNLRKLRPLGIGLGGLHAGFNKRHADDAIIHRREIIFIRVLTRDVRANRRDRFQIDIRKRLDERFGMTERQTREFLRHVGNVAVATPQDGTQS